MSEVLWMTLIADANGQIGLIVTVTEVQNIYVKLEKLGIS